MVGFTGQGAHALHILFQKRLRAIGIGCICRIQRMQKGHIAQGIAITAALAALLIHRRGIVLVVTSAIEEHAKTQGDRRWGWRAAAAHFHHRAFCLPKKHKQAPAHRRGTSGNGQPYVRHFCSSTPQREDKFTRRHWSPPPDGLKYQPLPGQLPSAASGPLPGTVADGTP
jgi:hypothetical protein